MPKTDRDDGRNSESRDASRDDRPQRSKLRQHVDTISNTVPPWARSIAMLASIAGTFLATYHSQREDARADSQASYETLAPIVRQQSRAIEDLEGNVRKCWDVAMLAAKTSGADTSPATRTPARGRRVAAPRVASGGAGAGSGSGFGSLGGSGAAGAGAAKAPAGGEDAPEPAPAVESGKAAHEEEPKQVMKPAPVPKSFDEAVEQWSSKRGSK